MLCVRIGSEDNPPMLTCTCVTSVVAVDRTGR